MNQEPKAADVSFERLVDRIHDIRWDLEMLMSQLIRNVRREEVVTEESERAPYRLASARIIREAEKLAANAKIAEARFRSSLQQCDRLRNDPGIGNMDYVLAVIANLTEEISKLTAATGPYPVIEAEHELNK